MTEEIEKGKAGNSFEDFLIKQGTYEDTTERAEKRIQAFRLAEKKKSSKR